MTYFNKILPKHIFLIIISIYFSIGHYNIKELINCYIITPSNSHQKYKKTAERHTFTDTPLIHYLANIYTFRKFSNVLTNLTVSQLSYAKYIKT